MEGQRRVGIPEGGDIHSPRGIVIVKIFETTKLKQPTRKLAGKLAIIVCSSELKER
ncbi:hypothetical protein PILCRDRAFT_811221 [Piloderma croceum F 1598]|uniref:Uncharacterized protein n=1 Tax=Piloderma croceum (strain F 1598) TaxID=765440 RepID=A0A0C3BW26_PILCF|nr:hypothetical protein PILCRDRAFT_811221 [Piloderma croceum F 1598]